MLSIQFEAYLDNLVHDVINTREVISVDVFDSILPMPGPWRWFDDTMMDCCEPLEKVKVSGISLDKVACLAYCNGAEVKAFHANESTIEDFRNYVVSCTSSEDRHLIVSYNRGCLQQVCMEHIILALKLMKTH